jgi:hypothetical protein
MGDTSNKDSYQNAINTLYHNIELVLTKAIPLLDTTNTDMVFGNKISSVLITTSSNLNSADPKAIENGVGIADINNCIEKIKQQNNLNSEVWVVYKTKDASLNLSNIVGDKVMAASSLKAELYNYNTGLKLNTSSCNTDSYRFQIPLKDSETFNLNRYRLLKTDNIDSLNINDAAFHDRCFSYIDKQYNVDTTINYRRKNYFQSMTVECSSNCSFLDIDENGYISCQCFGIDTEVVGNLIPSKLDEISSFNIGIINCIAEAFVNLY